MNQPTPRGAFVAVQQAFAAHLRNPEKYEAPIGLDARRVSTYCELFYNNVEGFIRNGFPVIRRLLSEQDWHLLMHDFYENHACVTPYFTDIGQEFVRFLQQERHGANDPPFLAELAHYEWVDVEIRAIRSPVEMTQAYDAKSDLALDAPLVLSPYVRPLQFQYPVHRIKHDYQPVEPPEQPTFLVVYCNKNDKVSFLSVNAMTYRLMQFILNEKCITGQQALEALAQEVPQVPFSTVLEFGAQELRQFKQKGIILGTAVVDACE